MSRRIRSLEPFEARGSLAGGRLARVADRVRQRVATRLGVRPYRVFLTWTRYGLSQDSERGDGGQRPFARVELLPTPRVTDLTGVIRRSFSVGTVPDGSIRVDRISAAAYTSDVLKGTRIPALVGPEAQPLPRADQEGPGGEAQFAEGVDFFYEVVEDGRGDDPAARQRFRLLAEPYRDAGGAQWVVALQRADRAMGRDGNPEPDGFPTVP